MITTPGPRPGARPRVGYLVHSAAPSGAELALLRAARLWADQMDLTLIFGSAGLMPARFSDAGIQTLVEPMPGSASATRRQSGVLATVTGVASLLRYALQLRRVLKQGKFDLVVAGSLKSVVYGRLATVGLGCRFVWSCHDRISSEYLGPIAHLYSRFLPRVIDGVVANSRSTLETIRIGSLPALVCPPGVDVGNGAAARSVETSVRNVGILGRLSPWKGQAEGIRAFALAGQPDLRLHVVGGALFGETDYAASLQDLAEELAISDCVTFYGHVDRPAELLDSIDLLLHTSVMPEPFGSVVVEGMNHGCVVVATSPGGPAEIIDDGQNGYLVPAGDVRAMADAIRRVASLTAAERAAVVAAGRTTAKRFDNVLVGRSRGRWLAAMARGVAPDGVVGWAELSGQETEK